MKLLVGKRVANVVSAYAPQVGRPQQEKDSFWDQLIEAVSRLLESEAVILGGDLNGHVGAAADGYDGVHGGLGFGRSAIDFLMVRRKDRFSVKNVKVIAGEECVSQHRLVVGDLALGPGGKMKKQQVPKLRVWRLARQDVKEKFLARVVELWDSTEVERSVEGCWSGRETS